ncbi:hypothetical protein D3C86_1714550 [compost metagenome]
MRRVVGQGRVGRLQGGAHVREDVLHAGQGLAIELGQAFVQFHQAVVQVVGNALERQLVEFVDHRLEALLQLFQAAGHRRDLQGACGHIERDFVRLGVEIQGHI